MSELTDVTANVVIYESFRGGRTRSAETPCPKRAKLYSSRSIGVSATYDLEFVERFYVGIQGTGANSAIQGHCEAR